MKSRRTAIAVVLACSGAAFGQSTWTNAGGGDWNLPGNWDTLNVPNLATESAVLGDLGSPYVVQFDLSASILGCALHQSATLNMEPGRVLGVNAGGIANNGVIVVNDAGSFSDAAIRADAAFSMTGSGSIELNSISADLNDARIDANPSFAITVGANQLIHGSGLINGPIVLNGTIDSDRDGRDLQLNGDYDLSGGGTIRGTNNGHIALVGHVTGGTVDGGVDAVNGGATIGDAITTGDNGVRPGATLSITGLGILNNGDWLVNTTGIFSDAVIRAGADVTIAGSGSIELNSTTADLNDARLEGQAGATMTIGALQTVHGSGRVNGPIALNGIIDADRDGRDLLVHGDVDASGGGMLVGSVGKIALQAAYTGGSIEGGVEAQTGSPSVNGTEALGTNGIRPNGTLSILSGGLTNNGLLFVNTDGIFADAVLRAAESAALDGSGTVELNSMTTDLNDARVDTAVGATLTIGADQQITGSGVVTGSFILDGAINADRDTRDIMVVGSVDMTGGGTMMGANGGKVSMRAATTGGTFAGGVEAETASGSVDGVTMTGTNGIRPTATLHVYDAGLTNNGLFVVNTAGSFSDSILRFDESCALDGAGTIDFNAITTDLADARIDMADGVTVTIGQDQALTGSGIINGTIALSQGSIQANRDTRDLRVNAEVDMSGGGFMLGSNGGKVALRGASVNGQWLGGVEAETGSPSIDGTVLSGANGIRPTTTLSIVGNGFTNNGTLEINTAASFSDGTLMSTGVQTIDGVGVLHLNGETADWNDAAIRTNVDGELTIGQGQTITGRGALDGLIHLPCQIAPGDDQDQTDLVRMDGTMGLAATSTVTMQIADTGSTNYDTFFGNAALALDGTLELELIDGFTPAFEDRFTIIDVGSLTGQFQTVVSPTIGLGVFRIVQTADKVEAVWTCQADLNGDGMLDFFDVQFFLNAFAEQALYGDYNEDGVNDFFDVQAFLNDFSTGCL